MRRSGTVPPAGFRAWRAGRFLSPPSARWIGGGLTLLFWLASAGLIAQDGLPAGAGEGAVSAPAEHHASAGDASSPGRPEAAAGTEEAEPASPGPRQKLHPWAQAIDDAAGKVVEVMAKFLFFDPVRAIWGEEAAAGLPPVRLVVLWLIFGAVTFTLLMGFINLRGLPHSLQLVRGTYTDPKAHGEVSHFQALCAALSATVGLGNIAGVALAVNLGGPGAVFWMVVAAFFGMTSKFVECTLGQKYRLIDERGRVSGGAMHYLRRGLSELRIGRFHLGPLGVVLSVAFAILCIGGSFGGGNMYQANQSYDALQSALGFEPDSFLGQYGSWIYGAVVALLVGLVIIGGIRRIATTAGRIVPFMCAVYVVGSLYIILSNAHQIGPAFGKILGEAFDPVALKGGFLGALLVGVQRAAFSNEAGVGSAAIAHSAARTDEPIREGLVALLEPFIDTIIVCSMTGIVVVITGAYDLERFRGATEGSAITVEAWRSVSDWFPLVLALSTILFAFSTLISWSYYGERCWAYLFGSRSTIIYKVIFLVFVLVGSVIRLSNVIDFSDMMILGMAFPNLFGCLLLSGKVRSDLLDYLRRRRAGEFRRFR